MTFSGLKRLWLYRAGGAAFVMLGLFLLGSVASFSISDPSWNTSTGAAPENMFGLPGAIIADAILQLLGGAWFVFVLPMLVWGGVAIVDGGNHAPEDRSPREVLVRIGVFPIVVALTVCALGLLPTPITWPFNTSPGGLMGDGLLGLVFDRAGLATLLRVALLLTLSTAALAGLALTCGLTRDRLLAAWAAGLWLNEWLQSFVSERLDAAGIDMPSPRQTNETWTDNDLGELAQPKGAELENSASEAASVDFEDESDTLVAPPSQRRIIREEPSKKKGRRETREIQPDFPVFSPGSYQLPALNLLAKVPASRGEVVSDEALEQNARMLENVLSDFGVRGEIINVRPGPVVTLYELEPAAGVKSSRVIGLADDIARSMAAVAARVAVIPGRNAIGIELPNQTRETVFIRELFSSDDFENTRGDLTLTLGKSIGGEPVFADLARMPHLLIAGTTGSGKSVGINTMILSLLFRLSPDECKLIMIDPKMLELSVYEGIPHLLAPVVTDPRKAVVALKWTVREMEERYRKMSKLGVRNIEGFNQRVAEADADGEVLTRTVHTGYDGETGEPVYESEELDYSAMPFIVVVIDEVADLMMVAGKDIEAMVQRLAQMARAAGIHLIMATQRPSVDVITGTIKANFPTRISFQVTSKIDSRTILGEQGAEQLLGMGDMLHMAGGGRIRRVHGAFVSDDEVEKVVKFLKKQGKPDYVQEVTEMREDEDGAVAGLDIGGNTSSGDALYDKAVAIVIRDRKASTSYVQRRLQIGYNRAATLIERMEEDGVISPANHAGKREVLVGEDAA